MTHPLISQLEKKLAGKTRVSLDPADPVYTKSAHASWKKDAIAGLFKDGTVVMDVSGKITVQDTSLSLVCSKLPVLNADAFGSAVAQKCWLEFAVNTDKAGKNSLTLLLWIKVDGKAPLIRGLYQPLCPDYEASFFAKNLRITEEAVLYNGGPALTDAASRLRFETRPGADKEVSIPSGPGVAAVVNNLVFLPFEFASKVSFAFTAPWLWKKPSGKAAGTTAKIPPALTLTSSRIDGTAEPVSFMTIATPKLVVDLKGEEKKDKKKEKNETGKSAPAAGDKKYALKSSFTLIANGTVSLPRPFAATVSAAYLPAADGSTASMKVVGDIVSKELPTADDIATLTGIHTWADLVPTKYAEYVKTIGLKRVGYTTQVKGKKGSEPSELAVTIQSQKPYLLHTGFLTDMNTTLGIDWSRKTEKAPDGKGKDKITTTTNVTATGDLIREKETWGIISFTLKNDTAFTGYVAVVPHGPDKTVATMTIPLIVGNLLNNAVSLDWMDKVVSLPLSRIDLALDKSAGTVSIAAKDLAPTITLFANDMSAGPGTLSLDLVKPPKEKKEIKESSKFQFASDTVRLRLQSNEKGDTIAAELGNPKKPDDNINVLALLENVLQADFQSKDFVIGVKSASLESFTAREEKKRGNDTPANSDDKEYKFRHAITGEAVLAVKEGAVPGFSGSLGVKLDAVKSRYRKKSGKSTGFTDAMQVKAASRLDMNIAKLPNLSLGLDLAYAKEGPASDAKTPEPVKADLTTTLTWKDLSLSYKSASEQTVYTVEFAKADWNLGRLVKNLLSAIGVGRDKAELYEPWNILYTIPLNNVHMEIVVKKSGENEVSLTLNKEWKLFFLTLEKIGLKYAKRDGSYRLSAIVSEKSTGHTETVDIVNADKPDEKPAPTAKSKAPKDMFTLNMLAVGRRMALIQSTAGVESVSTALDGIAAFVGKNAPAYADDVGWIFAADCAFNQKMIRLGLILYDPWLYGLHIEVTAGDFLKGLSFDILYKKLSDTLGVFKAQLVLPDRIRHLDFGGLAITLPGFALDIYTNGDFRVDIGFPWNGDFSRSGALTYGIFTGQAGIFFGVLSGATSDMVPKATVGSFKPVIEAGVGFTFFVGLNKTYGPASIIVGLGASAIIQGCYAKWSDPSGRTDAFYKVSGYLAVFGTISAKLDIKIISFEFSITVMISAALALEAYSKSRVRLDADLSITLKVRVLFFKVNFHFNYHFTYSLEFGSDKPKPWFINNREMAALPTAREIDSFIPNFAPLKTGKAGKTAALLHFCPQRLPGNQAIACLFTDAGSTTVRSMLETTLRWYLSSFSDGKSGSMDSDSADACTLSRQRLQRARDYLESHEYDNPAATMRYEHLEETLANIFTHTFKPLPIASNDTSAPGTMNPFPMIPTAYMYIKVGAETVREIRFDAEPDAAAQRAMGELLRSRQRTVPGERALADPDTRVPMARIMYFASFITALGTLSQALNPDELGDTITVGEVLRFISTPEKTSVWNDAAGLFAGSVYGGLQAKKPGENQLVSAFMLSHQQFAAGAGALGLDLGLTARATPDIPADRIWPDKVLADHAYAKTDTVPILNTHLLPQAVTLPRQFLLTSGSAYADRASGQTWCMYPSPAVLPKAMASLTSRPTFTIYRERKDQDAAPNRADAVSAGAEPVSGWKWALALDCLVVRQPGRKDVFRVIGVDDAGVQALEQMGFGSPFAAGTVYDLSLAWPADPAAGENAPLSFDSNLDHLSLARIDCEKETKPLTRGASVTDNVFVIGNTLLETSRVRASGCYLRYAAGTAFLPDGIFDEQGKTTLTFLFRYRQDGAAATPALFNRIMMTGAAEAGFELCIRPATAVPALVESVATVAQGSVGFRIDVGDMENAPAAAYNLLTCRPAGKWNEDTIDPARFPIIRPTKKTGRPGNRVRICLYPAAGRYSFRQRA